MAGQSKKLPAFDARRLMERAVEAMKDSIHEPRLDGKATPKVGVALWKPDGTVETACRGELRDGDHAEYTVLERKSRHQCLDGCTLFATLEPCSPSARRPPKISCAERIVLSRIKEVWVGIEDPDPSVDRKGIKHLENAGIVVRMFDRDLQDEIRAANGEFLEQALRRAEEWRTEPVRGISLSNLENAVSGASLDSLSDEALGVFGRRAGFGAEVDSKAFRERLALQGLLTREGGAWRPTGFGMLLFGREPRAALPQAALLATIHYPDGNDELMDFDGPMVLIPERLEAWIRGKLPNVVSRSRMQRTAVPPLPFEMVREAVVNAIVHRDYEIEEAKCQLVVTADTISVSSPGGPLPPITLEDLQTFNAPMLSRNPKLHYAFAQMELAEERGLGIRSLKSRAENAGLPLPRYRYSDPYLELVLYRHLEGADAGMPAQVLDALTAAERAGWRWLATKGKAKSSQYAAAHGVDERTARRHLNRFVELELVRKTGLGPATAYEVLG